MYVSRNKEQDGTPAECIQLSDRTYRTECADPEILGPRSQGSIRVRKTKPSGVRVYAASNSANVGDKPTKQRRHIFCQLPQCTTVFDEKSVFIYSVACCTMTFDYYYLERRHVTVLDIKNCVHVCVHKMMADVRPVHVSGTEHSSDLVSTETTLN